MNRLMLLAVIFIFSGCGYLIQPVTENEKINNNGGGTQVCSVTLPPSQGIAPCVGAKYLPPQPPEKNILPPIPTWPSNLKTVIKYSHRCTVSTVGKISEKESPKQSNGEFNLKVFNFSMEVNLN